MSYETQSFEGTEFIVIEGFGDPSSGPGGADGYLLFAGTAPPSGIGSYTNLAAYLAEEGSVVGTQSFPFLGRMNLNAATYKFRRFSELAPLLYQQPFSDLESLSADITAAASTLTINSGSGGVYAQNDVVFIDNEAIRITGDSGSGVYSIARGVWGTEAEAHETDAWVFTKNPAWKYRRVKRYIIDDAGNDQLRTTEQITSIKTGNSGTQVVIQTRSVLNPGSGLQVNLDSPDYLRRGDFVSLDVRRSFNDGFLLSASGSVEVGSLFDSSADVSRVFKVGSSLSKPTAIQVGPALTWATVNGDFLQFGGRTFLGTTYETEFPDGGGETETEGTIIGPIHELAVVSKAIDSFLDGIGGDPISFTRDLDYPYHPLSIVGALMLSNESTTIDTAGFNVLNGRYWSANLNEQLSVGSFLTDLTNLIEETSWMEIDDYILGWDGEPEDPWDIAFQLCAFFGFGIGVDNSGGPTIYRVRPADVGEYDAAFSNTVRPKMGDEGPVMEWNPLHEEVYNEVLFSVGERPWGDKGVPVRVPITNLQRSRATKYSSNKAMSFDAPFIAPGRAQAIRSLAVNKAVLLHYANPRLKVSVEDYEREGLNYDLGQLVRVNNIPLQRGGETLAWLIDSDGSETATSSGIAFLGRLVGREERLGSDRSFTLDMMMMNHRTGQLSLWRGPSAVVTVGTPSGSSVDLTVQTPSVFGAATGDDDEDWFTAGDEVRLYDRTLALDTTNSDSFEVTSVTASTITIAQTGAGANPATASGDFILRLAPFDPASGTGYENTNVLTNVDRVYAFLANDAVPHTIGTGAEEPGDIYGL